MQTRPGLQCGDVVLPRTLGLHPGWGRGLGPVHVLLASRWAQVRAPKAVSHGVLGPPWGSSGLWKEAAAGDKPQAVGHGNPKSRTSRGLAPPQAWSPAGWCSPPPLLRISFGCRAEVYGGAGLNQDRWFLLARVPSGNSVPVHSPIPASTPSPGFPWDRKPLPRVGEWWPVPQDLRLRRRPLLGDIYLEILFKRWLAPELS